MVKLVVYCYENETETVDERKVAFSMRYKGNIDALVDRIFKYGAGKLGVSCSQERFKDYVRAFGFHKLGLLMQRGSVSVSFVCDVDEELCKTFGIKETLSNTERRVFGYFKRKNPSIYAEKDGERAAFLCCSSVCLPAYIEQYVASFLRRRFGCQDVRYIPF